MKLVYFDDWRLGVVAGDDVVDVTDVVADIPHLDSRDLMRGLIERFQDLRGKLQAAADAGGGTPLANVRLRPPLPRPGKIDCMAVNYMEDGTRDAPAPINAFHKAASAIIGSGETMVLPNEPATIFEGEAELALVIGKTASNVAAADALDHIFGYVNFIDGSARGLPPAGNTFFQMKSRDTFAPIGPWLLTADEIADPQGLPVKLWVNGQVMQDFNTDDMAHPISRCIEWLSSIHTLEPGDLVATGTNHGGLNPFQDGDVVELEVEGLGRLNFNISDPLKRTWARETRLMRQQQGHDGPTPQLTGKYAP